MANKGTLINIRERLEKSMTELDDVDPSLVPYFFQAKKMLEYVIKDENSREMKEAIARGERERRDLHILYVLLRNDQYKAIAKKSGVTRFDYKFAGQSFTATEVSLMLEEITRHEFEMVEDY